MLTKEREAQLRIYVSPDSFERQAMWEVFQELDRLRSEVLRLRNKIPPTEGMSDYEKLIREGFYFDSDRDCDAAHYLTGVIDVIREDRERLRFQAELTDAAVMEKAAAEHRLAEVCRQRDAAREWLKRYRSKAESKGPQHIDGTPLADHAQHMLSLLQRFILAVGGFDTEEGIHPAALKSVLAEARKYFQAAKCPVCNGTGDICSHSRKPFAECSCEVCESGVETEIPCPVCKSLKQAESALSEYVKRQEEWSSRIFGHGCRTLGVTKHIEKELAEIRAKPHDLSEWIDVIILALDGYWRHGGDPQDIMKHLQAKQDKNISREWPKPISEDEAVEHVRTSEAESATRVTTCPFCNQASEHVISQPIPEKETL